MFRGSIARASGSRSTRISCAVTAWRSPRRRDGGAASGRLAQCAGDVVGHRPDPLDRALQLIGGDAETLRPVAALVVLVDVDPLAVHREIGRASCRERV